MHANTVEVDANLDETYEPPAVVVLGSVSNLTGTVGDISSLRDPT